MVIGVEAGEMHPRLEKFGANSVFRASASCSKKVSFRENCSFLGQIVIFRANFFCPPQ